jgi:transcription elongation factor GreA
VIGPTSTHDRSSEVLVTAEGYARLRGELEVMTTARRREIAERLRVAREDGDLADNPDLFEALEEQAALELRIATLEARLAAARIADGACVDGTAGIGTHVRVRDLDTGETAEYELVGAIEAEPAHAKISVEAPVGRALDGRRAGALVEVDAPRGRRRIELLAVWSARAAQTRRQAA